MSNTTLSPAAVRRKVYFDPKWALILGIVAFMLVFQIFPIFYLVIKAFFPYGAFTLSTFSRLYTYEMNWGALSNTLIAAFVTMVLGTLLGALLAALTCACSWADLLFSPVIRMIRAAPVVSFILLVMLAVYRSTVPMVIVTLMVLPVVWSNVKQGIGQADRQLLELGRAYRFSRWKKVKLISLPSFQPYFLSAVTTGMGLAWKSGAAAEVLCLTFSRVR